MNDESITINSVQNIQRILQHQGYYGAPMEHHYSMVHSN